MNTTIKVIIVLLACMYFTSCNDAAETTVKAGADTTGGRTMGNDTMNGRSAHEDSSKK